MLPLLSADLLAGYQFLIPPLLQSHSNNLRVTQTLKDLQFPEDPSSVIALQQVKQITRNLFPDDRAGEWC